MLDVIPLRWNHPCMLTRFIDGHARPRKIRIGESAYRNGNDVRQVFQSEEDCTSTDRTKLEGQCVPAVSRASEGCRYPVYSQHVTAPKTRLGAEDAAGSPLTRQTMAD